MPYVINKKCTRCGACLPECPTGSIAAGKELFAIDSDTCADHAACVAVCPVDAIHPLLVASDRAHPPEEEEEES